MHYIFDIIIESLIFVYDLLFTLIYRSFGNPAITIIILSIVINLIVLPLYKRADDLQKEEQLKKRSMERGVKHIRKTFKSDEQFMMLQAYYRVCHYNPLSFLKESVPLFLQIPFFIAAYRFISSLSILDGASFGPVSNLIEPDRLMTIGTLSVNILPVLMTLINLISGAIYSKDSDIKLKVQIGVTALIFLVLLYDSPSGLVIYWIMNNLFSLAKNIVFNQSAGIIKIVKASIAFIMLIVTEVLSLSFRIDTEPAELIVFCSIAYVLIILAGDRIKEYLVNRFPKLKGFNFTFTALPLSLIILTEAALVILLGLYIPSTVLSASALEFVNASTGLFNYSLLTYPLTIYAGLLLLWLTVLYYSYGTGGRLLITVMLTAGLIYSVVNQFVFSKSFGVLYTDLQYDDHVEYTVLYAVINAVAGLLILAVILLLLKKKPIILKYLAIIITIPLLVLSLRNISIIRADTKDAETGFETAESYEGILRLSRTGNNVVVFMLDRAIGGYIPYIFDEKPELMDHYQGFVYYPNTVSLGRCTNIGSPCLFGGYDYSPDQINLRTRESIRQKYNEALLMLPALFSQNGFDVTVIDPPYAGYSENPDLSIYDGYENVEAYCTRGVFSDDYISNELDNYSFDDKQRRNFVMFSMYRTSPVAMRRFIYDNGEYIYNAQSANYSRTLIDNISSLNRLTYMTSISNDMENGFLLLQNATPHNPVAISPPDYNLRTNRLFSNTDCEPYYQNREHNGRTMLIEEYYQWQHYCINIATYEELATWLDYLREEGVYDNTRIILVSDHGYWLDQFPDLFLNDRMDLERFCPLLMVKDFNSTGPFSVDDTFMTNADVPSLAMEGLINNPINPFTGNPITTDDKIDGVYITDSYSWHLDDTDGNGFDLSGSDWLLVRDNIYDLNNWQIVSEEEVLGR